MRTIRWGIVGAGGIAERFAEACNNTEGACLSAIASRDQQKADAFADRFGIEHRFGSYEDMAAFDGIDAAYIATPHALHGPNAMLFMNHGKAVLSEKPITVNRRELDKMIACAQQNRVFLMEGMWARLVPGTLKALEIVNSGTIGEVRGIQGSFCFEMYDEPDHHVFKPVYGGGSILDIGCYGLHFASWYMNAPVEQIETVADVGKTGVDEHCCFLLKYQNGAIASLSSAIMLRKPSEGYLFGDKGYIHFKGGFYSARDFEVTVYGGDTVAYHCDFYGNGFEEEIMEADRCIREGLLESPLIPHAQSLMIMDQMDLLRQKIGVRYPLDEG